MILFDKTQNKFWFCVSLHFVANQIYWGDRWNKRLDRITVRQTIGFPYQDSLQRIAAPSPLTEPQDPKVSSLSVKI